MFEKNINLTGLHAEYLKRLAVSKQDKALNESFALVNEDAEFKLFGRFFDVLLVGAIVGVTFGIKDEVDKTSEYKDSKATIFSDILFKEKSTIEYTYRLIMLTDNSMDLSNEEKIDRAFRDDAVDDYSDNLKSNIELFLGYARGGIRYMYERITHQAVTREDIIKNTVNFMKEVNLDSIQEGDADKLLDSLR